MLKRTVYADHGGLEQLHYRLQSCIGNLFQYDFPRQRRTGGQAGCLFTAGVDRVWFSKALKGLRMIKTTKSVCQPAEKDGYPHYSL